MVVDVVVVVREVLIVLRGRRRRRWRRRRLEIFLRVTLLSVEHDDGGWRLVVGFLQVVVLLVPPVVDFVVVPVEVVTGPEVQRVRRFPGLDGRVSELAERTQYGGRRLGENLDLIGGRHRLLVGQPVRVPDGRRDVHDFRDTVVRPGRPLVDARYRHPVFLQIVRDDLENRNVWISEI